MIAIAPPYYTEIPTYADWLNKRGFEYRILAIGEELTIYDDMLLLCGGADYGVRPERDKQEQTWITQAIKQDTPIVGICRGLQIVNLVLGGTLNENIETELKHTADVKDISGDKPIKESQFHRILLLPNMINDIEFEEYINVNSRHHQAIDKITNNLCINGIADDGIIEAAGNLNMHLVQWHPEREEVYDTPCERYVSDWIKNKLSI
jgi:putative glutamine amidotransferase